MKNRGIIFIAAGLLSCGSLWGHQNELSSSLPETNHSLFFDIGLLYLQMDTSSNAVCREQIAGSGTTASPTITNNYKSVKFGLDPGLKIGVGKTYKEKGYQLLANFEYISSSANLDAEATGTNFFEPIRITSQFYDTEVTNQMKFQDVCVTLAIDYFLLDLVISRGSVFSYNFSYTPFAGLKVTWLDFSKYQNFSNDVGEGTQMPDGSSWVRTEDSTFWGIGPEVGIDAIYNVFHNWSVYSCWDFAVLMGNASLDYRSGVVTSKTTPTEERNRDGVSVMCPTFKGVLGLQFDNRLVRLDHSLRLRLGFDMRYYFNPYISSNHTAQVKVSGGSKLDSSLSTVVYEYFSTTGLVLDFGWYF